MRKSPNTKLVEDIEQLLKSYQAFQPNDHTGAIAKLTISAIAGAIEHTRESALNHAAANAKILAEAVVAATHLREVP